MFCRCVWVMLPFTLLLLTGCQRPQASPAATHESDVKALRDVDAAWSQAWAARDIERALSFYADDGTVMFPNMAAIKGRDNIRTMEKPFFADPNFKLHFESVQVDVAQSGDMGYTQGTLAYTMTDPSTNKPVSDTAKYLTVWRKQPDGNWRAVQDAYNSDLPLPAPNK